MRTATIATILLAGLLGTGAGQAQLWRGPAAIEIEAKDQKRGPLAGGEVKLVCRGIEPADGPPPVTLDSKGRAVVGGLAEGKWHVEVSKDSYMTFQADLDVRSDRKPKILSTLQLNVPHAIHMMDVLFYKGKAAPEAHTAIAAAPPPPPVEHRRPISPAPQAPPPPPAPAAAPEATVPTTTQPAPHIEPVTKPVVPREPPAAAPPATPPPTPPPAPAVVAPPAPAPQPSAAPTSPASVRRRSYDDRNCFECKPGESSLSMEAVVAPGAEGCGAAVRDLLAKPAAGPPAGCRVLRLTLPAGARYTGYRYGVEEGTEELDCQAGKDCPGGGRWPLEPALAKSASGTTIAAAFEGNAAVTKERHAVFTVYYTAGK
ncbi:MAG TPA: hypothetical protein VH988_24815 [Thermoanaerobaculia bacterium]|nr:hypothetical protein [Thermoanaerobaculia bacterium]